MASAAARHFGSRVRSGLVVGVTRDGAPAGFETIVGGHPIPTESSERAGRRALAMAESLEADEALVILLSGGASALMAVPADEVTLDDKRATTDRLLRAGADIHALNTVRKHLSAIKGGWLAAHARGPCRALAISDVEGGRRQPLRGRARCAPAVRRRGRLSIRRRVTAAARRRRRGS
jgi:hydroxypyruvate reductase